METEQAQIIILGEGVGALRFGQNRDGVRAILGEPEEVEASEEEDDFVHEAWNYLERNFSLYFDQEDEYRLSCIETDHPNLTLFGQKLMGLSPEAVEELMAANGHEEPEEETMDPGEVQLSYVRQMIDFYFVDEELVVVNFGVFINEETLEPAWPA